MALLVRNRYATASEEQWKVVSQTDCRVSAAQPEPPFLSLWVGGWWCGWGWGGLDLRPVAAAHALTLPVAVWRWTGQRTAVQVRACILQPRADARPAEPVDRGPVRHALRAEPWCSTRVDHPSWLTGLSVALACGCALSQPGSATRS